MPYSSHSDEDIAAMLRELGRRSLDELFESIPRNLRTHSEATIAGPLDELSLHRFANDCAARVVTFREMYRGAGAYHHYIPAAVEEIVSRQEYYTAYTPYQAEVSQGTLQALFEYQTMMTELTGFEVSNASLYDGASATAEAALMLWRANGKRNVLVSEGLHPEYQTVLGTYLRNVDLKMVPVMLKQGTTDAVGLDETDTSKVSSVIVQNPNFYGFIEDIGAIRDACGSAPIIQVTNEAMALTVLRSPEEAGADVCCGDAQSFGIPLSFGGPYLGYLTCRKEYLHLLPGRVFGATYDSNGKRAFTMALAAREQHIRRERATSNICTNHALCAIRAAVYLALMGSEGTARAADLSCRNAHRLHAMVSDLPNVCIENSVPPFFNEFAANIVVDAEKLSGFLGRRGILGPLPVRRFHPGKPDTYLFAATEMNTDEGMEAVVEAIREASL